MNNTDWIVAISLQKLLCKRCQRTYRINLPASMKMYTQIIKAFESDHRGCKDLREESDRPIEQNTP